MKARKLIVVSVAVAALVCMCIGAVVAAKGAPQGVIEMTVPEGVKSTRPKVDFDHKFHTEFDCARCHHQWDGKSEIQACNTSGCHDNYKSMGAANSYFKAFHANINPGVNHESCMNCHRTLQQEGKKAGPTSCAKGKSCHVFE